MSKRAKAAFDAHNRLAEARKRIEAEEAMTRELHSSATCLGCGVRLPEDCATGFCGGLDCAKSPPAPVGWPTPIPVADRLPDLDPDVPGHSVDVLCWSALWAEWITGDYYVPARCFDLRHYGFDSTVSHWLPKPSPPA